MKLKIIIFLLLGFVGCLAFILKKSTNEKDHTTFVVGTTSGYAPFVSINEKGEYEGFDIDFAQALAQTMGKKLEIKDLGSMTPLFIALENGTIDAIIWGLSIIKERLDKVEMIRYQGETITTYPLVFWQSIPEGIASLDDMKELTVCVEPGSSQEVVLNKYPQVKKLLVDKVDDALLNIQYKKADAALLDPVIAKKFKNKYSDVKILDVMLTPDDQIEGVGIALKRNNKSLINSVSQAVIQLKKEGIIKNFEKKWDL
jgi:arginine/lysine/histidine transporter system substrate-binding protein